MLIVGRRAGRLGNRLFTFAHFIGNAIEYNYEIYNPAFHEYANYFKGTENQVFAMYPKGWTIGNHLVKLFFRIICQKLIYIITYLFVKRIIPWKHSRYHEVITIQYPERYDWLGSGYLEFVHSKLVISNSWVFWDHHNLNKHAGAIRDYFSLQRPYQANVRNLIENSRKGADILVGVHIRQGDYKRWLGGKYYYTFEQYAMLIDKVKSLFPANKVNFLILSNNLEVKVKFQGTEYKFGSEHFIEDMYALAECDYIIGPPSSYSGWAAFYGNKKIYFVENIDRNFVLDDFSYFNSAEYFSH